MSDYNKYVLAVNKIFEIMANMKKGFDDQDNLVYIASIEEYRQTVINAAERFSNNSHQSNVQPKKVENLGEEL